ncbi:MAG: uracil-DNA glycosylase [Peptostreptococcaceae bacterium]|nr:uracil-DNA glycosylase [Peptostreptococcaceae bacterium]
MDNISKLYQKTLLYGNTEIAYLTTRAMMPSKERELIYVDEHRLKNELRLYKYNREKGFPSLLSSLIPIIIANPSIEKSYEQAIILVEMIRRQVTVQNKMGVTLLCHLLYNIEDFNAKFAEFKMLDASKEEEVAFQKAKIDIILNKKTLNELILEFLSEHDAENNNNLLEKLKSDEEKISVDTTAEKMSNYLLKLSRFEVSPKSLAGNFDMVAICKKQAHEKGSDALLGNYLVAEKDLEGQTVTLETKRGRLVLDLPAPTGKPSPVQAVSESNNTQVHAMGTQDLPEHQETQPLTMEERFALQKLSGRWAKVMEEALEKSYFSELLSQVDELYRQKNIHPRQNQVFRALIEVPYESTRVVILGQDPYHNVGQANGMCFSVNSGVKAPPSLVNIFKELQNEFGEFRTDVDLSDWAKQGVLLLNSVLTVEHSKAASHANMGWEIFTDKIIEELNKREEPMVFILWGNYAAAKAKNVDMQKHLVLKSNHPSPFSAHKGFFGNNHFILTNRFLKENNQQEVVWI